MNSDRDTPLRGWVAPFGDPGINDRSHLPRAFRSVPRPSSPLSAKASTRCPCFVARSNAAAPDMSLSGPTASTTSQNRRAQGQAPTDSRETCRGDSMKTLLRTAPHPGIAPGHHPRTANPCLAARPPRSHSQIHFTLQSTPAPAPAPPADTRPPGRPAPGNETLSSPNAGPGDQEPGVRTPRSGRSSDLCRRSSRPGGGERDRTDDLLLAKQALSQLSYTPAPEDRGRQQNHRISAALCTSEIPASELVGQGGFEPPTSRLSSARSNQLSY